MISKALKVGEVAKACGIGVEAVRFYERRGLLPKPARLPSGYRVYEAKTVSLLRFISQVKYLGFTLKETKEMLDLIGQSGSNCESICERVRSKKVQLDDKINQLQQIRKILERLETDCPGGIASLDDCVMMQYFNGED